MNLSNLYKLEKKDINKGAEILAKSFYDYPTMKYILGDKHNNENLKLVLKFILKYAVFYGEAYASSTDLEGVILFSNYEDYSFSLIRSLRSGVLSLFKLGAEVGKRFNNYNEFCIEVHGKIIQKPHQYIIALGVDPEKQGQGFASKLMLPILKLAEAKDQSCYLETHGEENLNIYKRYGFELISEDIIPNTDIVQYSMLKK